MIVLYVCMAGLVPMPLRRRRPTSTSPLRGPVHPRHQRLDDHREGRVQRAQVFAHRRPRVDERLLELDDAVSGTGAYRTVTDVNPSINHRLAVLLAVL